MPMVACPTCGAKYNLRDEFIGRSVACAQCGNAFDALPSAEMTAQPQAHAIYDRDRFFMRQKVMSINARYTINDEAGLPIIHVIRRAHFLKAALATLAAIVTFIVIAGGAVALSLYATDEGRRAGGEPAMFAGMALGVLLGAVASVWAAVAIYPKRHVEFYADEAHTQPILNVQQDAKWQIINATYTLRDADGTALARFHKNYLYNFFRRRWNVLAPTPGDETMICRAFEDSILLSILRRFLGTFYGLLRTNFIINEGDSERTIGEFNRKFTLTDQYVLDLSGDPTRSLDRRIVVALGVMLDTGERR